MHSMHIIAARGGLTGACGDTSHLHTFNCLPVLPFPDDLPPNKPPPSPFVEL